MQNFAGLKRNDTCSSVPCGAGTPPDTNGAVGPNNYIQSVNSSFGIYSKTGTLQASFTENALFATSGTNPCNGNSFGDPVVVYDAIADRWILTNFAFALVAGNPVAPYYECIAVSKTGDPVNGGWYLYPLQWDAGRGPAEHAQRLPEVRGLERLPLLLVQRLPERRHLQRRRLRRHQPRRHVRRASPCTGGWAS